MQNVSDLDLKNTNDTSDIFKSQVLKFGRSAKKKKLKKTLLWWNEKIEGKKVGTKTRFLIILWHMKKLMAAGLTLLYLMSHERNWNWGLILFSFPICEWLGKLIKK